MRTAAKSVAVTHAHYVEHCNVMSKLKGKPEAMAINLKQRKDAHVAYHVALAFLKTATLKHNPQLDLGQNQSITWKDRPAKQELLNTHVDAVLNQLIHEQEEQAALPEKTDHIILRKEEELVWN